MNIELKDYFAAKAMQGLMSSGLQMSIDDIVLTSYNIAQKMVEKRNKERMQKYIDCSKQINLDDVENL
jgi:hypothetical protein